MGLFFFGGLITFLAARLTRYSLGLAATLSTLLLHRTLAQGYQLLLVTCKTLLIFALLFLGGGVGGVLGGADNVLGCPPYKIFSWTCCYAIHSSLAPYPGTRYQLLLVTCKTLLIFALLFLGGVLGGADNVLGCPPYKIFSWTCCYAIHSSLAPYPGTRYQLLLVTCKTLLIFALLFLGGVLGGLITFLNVNRSPIRSSNSPVL